MSSPSSQAGAHTFHAGAHTAIFERASALLEAMVALSSPSDDGPGLFRAARHLAQALAARGLEVDLAEEVGAGGLDLPVLHARSPARAGQPLLLVGHLDTVLPADRPERRDGRLWGAGAVDMKGGLAAFVGALDQLRHEGRPAPDGLHLLVLPDEEVAGPLSRRLVREHGRQARALWVLEPGRPIDSRGEILPDEATAEQLDGETLVVGRRGLLHWQLDAHGQTAHAGNGFWQGRSALVAAAEWSVAARALARPGPGPTVNVGRMVAGERAFVETLAEHADLLFSPRQTNVVPDRARVEGEARYRTATEARELRLELAAAAREIGERHGVELAFRVSSTVPAVDPGEASWRWARQAVERAAARGWRLEVESDRGGISFSNFLEPGSELPILDGLGPVGGGMHTREEYVDLGSLGRRIALLADLLELEAKQPAAGS